MPVCGSPFPSSSSSSPTHLRAVISRAPSGYYFNAKFTATRLFSALSIRHSRVLSTRETNIILTPCKPLLLSLSLSSISPGITTASSTIATTPTARRKFGSSAAARNKMSDEDYLAFLDKANKKPSEEGGGGAATNTKQAAAGGVSFRTLDDGVEVPKVLREAVADEWYVSDADERFESVGLKFDDVGDGGRLPDEEEFAKLIGHWDPANAEVEILDPVDWDSRGQYNKVVEGVRKAGGGADVRVYKVGRGDGVRWEYWVVTVADKGNGKKALLGAKVLAVES